MPRAFKDVPVPIVAVDDRPIASGFITQDVVAALRIKGHSENIRLAVVSVHYPIILGLDWLTRHNPAVDWASRKLTFSCCDSEESIYIDQGHGFTRPPEHLSLAASGRIGSRLTSMPHRINLEHEIQHLPIYRDAIPRLHSIIDTRYGTGIGSRHTRFFPS